MPNRFSSFWAVFRREMVHIATHPVYAVMTIVLPLVAFLFFGLLFEKGVPRDIPIAVVDDDHTELSRQLVRMLDATPAAEVRYTIPSIEEGERMMRSGRIEAIVRIPSNFEKSLLSTTQTEVVAYVSGKNISVNGLLSKDLLTTVTTFSSGVQIQTLMKQGLSQGEAYAQMMPVRFDRHVLFNPYINYGYYLLPSFMPMMLMIFALMATIYSVGSELKESTAGAWMARAGGRIGVALAGKLLPVTAVMMVMCLLMNFIMYKWIGVPLNGSHALLIFGSLIFILSYQSIGILFITLLANMRLALSLGGGYSVLAFTFSGLTFPIMAMSLPIRMLTHLFPFTAYTFLFIDQAMRGAPVHYSLPYIGEMMLFMLLPLLCLPRLGRIASDRHYWGRI